MLENLRLLTGLSVSLTFELHYTLNNFKMHRPVSQQTEPGKKFDKGWEYVVQVRARVMWCGT